MQPANANELVNYLLLLAQLSDDGVTILFEDGQLKIGVLDIEITPEDWLSKPIPISELPIPVAVDGLQG